MFDCAASCMLTKVTRGSGQRARKHTTAPSTEESITGECRAMVVQQGSWWLATGEWADSKRVGYSNEVYIVVYAQMAMARSAVVRRKLPQVIKELQPDKQCPRLPLCNRGAVQSVTGLTTQVPARKCYVCRALRGLVRCSLFKTQ